MAKFKYTALDAKGQEFAGEMDADSEAAVLAKIREKGLFPTNISAAGDKPAKKAKRAAVPAASSKGLQMELKIPTFLVRVKTKQLMVLTRQLATLINAGLPLLRGLRVLYKQEKNQRLKQTVGEMAESIESGSTFAEALAQHPRIFNKLFVNMVKAGEIGGVLDVVLTRLAEFMEKAQKIKSKIISAMVYPVVVLTARASMAEYFADKQIAGFIAKH